MPVVNGKKYPYTAKGKAAAKKAAKTSYLGNVVKEVKQTAKSASNAVDKYLNGNRPLPKGIKIGSSNVRKEAGQLAGAVLQGRRYDESGKQIKKSTTSDIAKKLKDMKPLNLDAKGNAQSRRRSGTTPMPRKVSPNEGRTRRRGTPMPKKVSPNAGRSSYRGGPLRAKKGM